MKKRIFGILFIIFIIFFVYSLLTGRMIRFHTWNGTWEKIERSSLAEGMKEGGELFKAVEGVLPPF